MIKLTNEEDIIMKRFVSMIVLVVLCATFVVSAMASTVEFSYNGSGSSFVRWSETTSSVGTTWCVSSWDSSNLSSSRVANVKIYHAPGVYASHTFKYSTESTKDHDYTAYANGQDVYMAGHKKSGKGNVTVSGDFEP